jgi:flavin reductase (DIM6/NTAB) family NADH-FMN oxidoreductase RutF
LTGTPIDTREFRHALGCFATGVTVVTTLDDKGQAIGITVNSFTSVSLDPPLVLWCADRKTAGREAFHSCTNFVISVLDTSGADLATRFAMKGGYAVEGVDTIPTRLGPPALSQALAVFECETHARHDGGDHVILIGKVCGFTYVSDPERKGTPPLVYYRGRFGTVSDLSG